MVDMCIDRFRMKMKVREERRINQRASKRTIDRASERASERANERTRERENEKDNNISIKDRSNNGLLDSSSSLTSLLGRTRVGANAAAPADVSSTVVDGICNEQSLSTDGVDIVDGM